jgi:hypothetical protein
MIEMSRYKELKKIECIAFVRRQIPDATDRQIMGILYIADRAALGGHGCPITFDGYFADNDGVILFDIQSLLVNLQVDPFIEHPEGWNASEYEQGLMQLACKSAIRDASFVESQLKSYGELATVRNVQVSDGIINLTQISYAESLKELGFSESESAHVVEELTHHKMVIEMHSSEGQR